MTEQIKPTRADGGAQPNLWKEVQSLRVYVGFMRPFDVEVGADEVYEIARDNQAEIVHRLKLIEEQLRGSAASVRIIEPELDLHSIKTWLATMKRIPAPVTALKYVEALVSEIERLRASDGGSLPQQKKSTKS